MSAFIGLLKQIFSVLEILLQSMYRPTAVYVEFFLKKVIYTALWHIIIFRAGQVRKLVRKSANPQLRTNEKCCGHADLRTLAV